MSQIDLIIIVLGGVGMFALAVIAYINKTRQNELSELIALVKPLAESLVQRADVALAPLGQQLKPLHNAAVAADQLFDEPSDFLVQYIKNPAVVAAIREIIRETQDLTDGEPPTEAQPLGERR